MRPSHIGWAIERQIDHTTSFTEVVKRLTQRNSMRPVVLRLKPTRIIDSGIKRTEGFFVLGVVQWRSEKATHKFVCRFIRVSQTGFNKFFPLDR
jgi:hypothetical protein